MVQPVNVVSGSFTGTTASAALGGATEFNMSLSGFGSATVQLQRSFDQGATWLVVQAFTTDAEKRIDEPETKVLWRFNCSAFVSGPIVFRLSKSIR